MSIFDKDLIEISPHIPKEDAIKYSLDWTLQRAKTYLSEYLKFKKRTSKTLAFCQEYLRVSCDDLLRGIWMNGVIPSRNSGSTIVLDSVTEHPEECWEYPAIRSYDVKVDYTAGQTYLFTIYITYRTRADLTYKYYAAHVDL